MTLQEAQWVGRILGEYDSTQLSPLLNIGSSDEHYRKVVCPEIDSCIFAPLRTRGIKTCNLDLKASPGVDIVGDLLDPSIYEVLCSFRTKALLCSNVLEHVLDVRRFVSQMAGLLQKGDLLFLTVPYRYPYHPDPIDNSFRASLVELTDFVSPYFVLERGTELVTGSYLKSLLSKKKLIARDFALLVKSAYNSQKRKVLLSNYRFLTKDFVATCGVFRKKPLGV